MDARVHFRDLKPYSAPGSLDDLRGPSTGVIELPHSVYWQARRRMDLGARADVRTAYRALLAEGLVEDQIEAMNRDLLVDVWSELTMDQRVRDLWEGRFAELREARSRASASRATLPEADPSPL